MYSISIRHSPPPWPQVDELIRAELEDLTYAVDRIPRKNEKGDKKKKNKEKTAKGAKGDLTANRTIEELFEELVEQGIIRYSPKATLDDFIGDYSYSGAALDYAKKDPLPSLADVRRMVTEFAVLPLSSQTIHQQAPLTRYDARITGRGEVDRLADGDNDSISIK